VVNKLRALGSYYSRGLTNGSQLRTAINTAESLEAVTDAIVAFFQCESPDRLLAGSAFASVDTRQDCGREDDTWSYDKNSELR
jgi:hypothetical protein